MQMLAEVDFPNEPFNSLVKNGTVGETLQRILGDIKPAAAYFTERDGHRGAVLVVDVTDASSILALAEPFFVMLNANVKFRICMTPEDLGKAGLDDIGKKLA